MIEVNTSMSAPLVIIPEDTDEVATREAIPVTPKNNPTNIEVLEVGLFIKLPIIERLLLGSICPVIINNKSIMIRLIIILVSFPMNFSPFPFYTVISLNSFLNIKIKPAKLLNIAIPYCLLN